MELSLTEGGEVGVVSSKYWKKVVGRKQDVGVLWEDGREVAELPQGVKGRKPPMGKGPRRDRDGEKSGRGRGGRMKQSGALHSEGDLGTGGGT